MLMDYSGPVFPGFRKATDDFRAVRDGRRSPLLWLDVDLSVARSVAAATQLTLPISANFLYVDQRPNTGFATAHFQDTNPAAAPVTLFAGALWRVPFTRLAIENDAQPGSSLRLIYGLDVDALPISAAGVTVLNAININDQISALCGIYNLAIPVGVGANQVTLLIAPALNVRGIVLRQFTHNVQAGAGGSIASGFMASAAAPVSPGATQANAILFSSMFETAGVLQSLRYSDLTRRIPANWGIYNICSISVAGAPIHGCIFSAEIL